MANFEDTVRTMVRARHPVLWLVTHEEERALRVLRAVTDNPHPTKKDAQKKDLVVWSVSTGFTTQAKDGSWQPVDAEGQDKDPVVALQKIQDEARDGKGTPKIYVLRDLHRFLGDQTVTYRFVRDTAATLKLSHSTVVVTSPVNHLPLELQKDVTVLDMPLPTADELRPVLERVIAPVKAEIEVPENGVVEKVLKAGLGLTEDEFSAVVRESLVRFKKVDPKVVVSAKEQIIRKSGVLEFYQTVEGLEDVGGLDDLKAWLKRRALAFSDKAQKFGLRPPKGLFLTGPPGTGKSLTAKALANLLGVPLLWAQPDKVFSKFVGESEQNIRQMLNIADAVAPAILFFDETEKFLSGAASGGGDSGVSRRVFGSVLTWMQEHKTPVLVVATANDPLGIPPEFMSRFDAVFFVDMPGIDERLAIFDIHLRRVGRKPKNFNMVGLARETKGFSGREIERGVNEALFSAFERGDDLTTEDLLGAFQGVKPLSETRKGEIEAMRAWARQNAIPASRKAEATRAMAPVAEV